MPRGEEGRAHAPVTHRKGAAAFEERARELRLVETLGRNRLPEGLFLVMQPIMSLSAPTESLNFEVLLRMRAPDGATLPRSQGGRGGGGVGQHRGHRPVGHHHAAGAG